MEALPCFHRDFRQQVVQDHQVSVLPAAGFLIDGDVGQVVHVFFFRRFRDEYIPGGFLQRFCFRQGTEGSGLFLCFFQGVIYAEDTADQGGDSQQEKDLPVVLQEKEGDRLYQQPGSKDGAEPDQLGFDCPDRIQGQLQLFLRAVFTDPVLLFIAQCLDFPFAAEAPYGKRTDLQRPDRICGRTAAPSTGYFSFIIAYRSEKVNPHPALFLDRL